MTNLWNFSSGDEKLAAVENRERLLYLISEFYVIRLERWNFERGDFGNEIYQWLVYFVCQGSTFSFWKAIWGKFRSNNTRSDLIYQCVTVSIKNNQLLILIRLIYKKENITFNIFELLHLKQPESEHKKLLAEITYRGDLFSGTYLHCLSPLLDRYHWARRTVGLIAILAAQKLENQSHIFLLRCSQTLFYVFSSRCLT